MASKMSFRKAQIPLSCQICMDPKQIRWKCIDCVRLICETCKDTHRRIPSTENHEFVSIKEYGMSSRWADSKLCKIHNKSFSLHCTTCDIFVCMDCVTDTHNAHTFNKLQLVLEQKVKGCQEELRKECDMKVEILKKYEETKQNATTILESTEMLVMNREEELKKCITDWKNSLMKEIKECQMSYTKDVDDKINEIKGTIVSFNEAISTLSTSTQKWEPTAIIEYLQELKNKMDLAKIPEPRAPKLLFVQGNLKLDDEMKLLGHISLERQDVHTEGNGNEDTSTEKRFVTATYSYDADNEDELSFKEGDTIKLISKEVENGWSKGSINGKIGVFPTNYTNLIDLATVLFEYTPQHDDELKLEVDCIIEVLRKDGEEGWWYGRYKDKEGYFPDNYVKIKK